MINRKNQEYVKLSITGFSTGNSEETRLYNIHEYRTKLRPMFECSVLFLLSFSCK